MVDMKRQGKGKVVLVAAGPGDPDLITVRGAQWLAKADVILTDRLVSREILTRYASPLAKLIEVGKQAGSGSSTPQSEIGRLMLEHAIGNKLVVRLKGGDVSIYSNILDELEILVAYEVPFEIVPGVTAALGAAAYAGIPLTARGYSTGVRLLTYYRDSAVSESQWHDLAHTEDTLVFYMSSQSLPALAARLFEAGMSGDKPLVIIEQATTESQMVHPSDIRQCLATPPAHRSPALVVIGDVARLHNKFSWFHPNREGSEYFESLPSVLSPNVQTPDHAS